MSKKTFYIFLISILSINSGAQTGGDNVYEFLNLTHSGLVSSLGGTNVSLFNDNLNLAYHNPSLLTPEMNKSLALNYVNYFAGVNYGMVMYSFSIRLLRFRILQNHLHQHLELEFLHQNFDSFDSFLVLQKCFLLCQIWANNIWHHS